MVWPKQAAALAIVALPAVAHAAILRDISGLAEHADLAGNGAPLPSVPAAGNRKRQASGGFLDSTPGSGTTGACEEATTFSLNNFGQLEVSGQVISMNPGTPYIALRPISPQGSITITFSLNNGALAWTNAAFFGGQAGFCQDTTGQVFATFVDPAVAYPPNCAAVALGPIVASTCGAGGSTTGGTTASPIVTSLGSTIVSTGTDGSVFSSVSTFASTISGPITSAPTDAPAVPTPVVNGTLTLRPGLYAEGNFVNPAGQTCSVVTESWIFGDTTLLPHTATTTVV
ncbi:putative wsc domain-containing protein [Colletotrichum asianum]